MACFIMTGEIMGGEIMGGKIWRNKSKTANFFPVIISLVISASQNVSYISREFTRFLLSQMHLPALYQ